MSRLSAAPLALLAGCGWFDTEKPPVTPPPPEAPPVASGPELPPPPRVGVAEVAPPPGVLLPEAVDDQRSPPLVDVWVDPDVSSFAELGAQLDAWGLTRVDGDGEVWRVSATDAPFLVERLAAAPGVLRAREALSRPPLADGSFRKGSAKYGAATWTWTLVEGGPKLALHGGEPVPPPVLPEALPAGALRCLGSLQGELADGGVRGVGWERALSTEPRAWVVLVESYGPCGATGWLRMTKDGPVDQLSFRGHTLAESDDAWLVEGTIQWLASPRPEDDPAVLDAVDALAKAPDADLARAMRDAGSPAVQGLLYQAFANRDPEAAMAVAGGAAAPTLRAQAVGQDEELRRQVLADPSAKAAELAAALVTWRPGPNDPPGFWERVSTSRSVLVRTRAWEAKAAATESECAAKAKAATDAAALAATWDTCPQPAVRADVGARLRAADPAAADAALARTLAKPETVEAGVAAARAADAAGRRALLVACVEDTNVRREVRTLALELLLKAKSPDAARLVQKHGAFLGVKAPEGLAGGGGPPVAGGEGRAPGANP